MKRLSFVFLLAFAGRMGVGVAQTETTSDYKLKKGDVTTELQLSLFSTSGKLHYEDGDGYGYEGASYTSGGPLSLSGLRLRYALNEKLALRLTAGLNFGHNNYKRKYDNDTTYNYNYRYMEVANGSATNKGRATEFLIAPGIEYHFGKWERMSIYIGGELLFGMKTTQNSLDVNKQTDVYEQGGWGLYWSGARKEVSSLTMKNCVRTNGNYRDPVYKQNGTMFFGINAVLGMDFYVYKGLYLGAELNLGYRNDMLLSGSVKGNTIIKDEDSTILLETKIDKKIKDDGSEGNLAFKCNPMIRIGWKF